MDNPTTPQISPEEARSQLWHMGYLSWKLDSTQEQIYNFIQGNTEKINVLSCSRRLGKSYLMLIIAFEQCLKFPGSIVKIVEPEIKMIKRDVRQLVRQITKDCPRDIMPEFRVHDNIYTFPNGSEIQLAGSDNGNGESLRGGSAHLCIVDEAGFCDDLEYLLQSVLIPTTLTTKGRILLASTPPRSPDHEFIKFVKQAESKGTIIKRTIYDNPRITPDDIEEILKPYPDGVNDIQFRREYLAEFLVSQDDAVIPEFTQQLQDDIIKEWPRPPFFDAYTAADIGFRDLTVVLFAYYDYRKAVVVIEDEVVMNGRKMTTEALALAIKEKENKLWVDPMTFETRAPLLRVSDNDLRLINDLNILHGITFLPTAKDNAEAALNNMKIYLSQGRIIINPRCKTLIFHLRNATWNKQRSSYDRSPDAGHYDAIDALKYLIRNINFQRNPYPSDYNFTHIATDDRLFPSNYKKPNTSNVITHFEDMFKVKKVGKRNPGFNK